MDDKMMNMLLGSGAESMEDVMLKMMMGLGMDSSSSYGMCTEGDWIDHPLRNLFLAARRRDASLVVSLLQQGAEKYRLGVDELDGDGAGVLHILALDKDLEEEDAETIVQAFKDAGADLDLKGGSMMSGETPLHVAACYGNFAIAKALIDAGAKADICDNSGKTPLYRAMKDKSSDGQKTMKLIRSAVSRERSDPNYIDAVTMRKYEIQQQAKVYWAAEETGLAMKKYYEVLQLPGCDKDHDDHGNLAGAALVDAIIKKTSGEIGSRNSFKIAYEAASKAVEIEPTYERGWEEMARAYMGYHEMPRAKQACKNGLVHFPKNQKLNDIWTVLDEAGVPDEVVDHESQEYKDIYKRIYIDRWIGSVGCSYCALNCMDEPRPEKCPFCGCPEGEIDEDTYDMIICLVSTGKKEWDIDDDEDDEDSDYSEDIEELTFEEPCASKTDVGDDEEDDDDDYSGDIEELTFEEPCTSKTNTFTFATPSQNSSTSFDFGSPSDGTDTKFVFGSPENK